MSVESARAFCMRLMSDDEFRDSIGAVTSAAAISELLKKEEYDFSKHDLLKIVSELTKKEIAAEQLEQMVRSVFEEEIAVSGNANASEYVGEWFRTLA